MQPLRKRQQAIMSTWTSPTQMLLNTRVVKYRNNLPIKLVLCTTEHPFSSHLAPGHVFSGDLSFAFHLFLK